MEKHQIKRDGLPPIAFIGECIGSGSNKIQGGNRANRWTEVDIYRTKGGRFVGAVRRRTCWQGESDHDSAGSFATAPDVIGWLRGDNGGDELGAVSQEAVEKAVENDPAFAVAWIETVE